MTEVRSAILPRIVGLSNAAELLFTGRAVTGVEAAAMGLVSSAVPVEDVVPVARELAADIAVNSAPVSVAMSKQLLWQGLDASIEEMHRREHEPFAWAGEQLDAREGIESFLEKRRPDWKLSAVRDFPEELFPR